MTERRYGGAPPCYHGERCVVLGRYGHPLRVVGIDGITPRCRHLSFTMPTDALMQTTKGSLIECSYSLKGVLNGLM